MVYTVHKIENIDNNNEISVMRNEKAIEYMSPEGIANEIKSFENRCNINKGANINLDDALLFFDYSQINDDILNEKIYTIQKEKMNRLLTPIMNVLVKKKDEFGCMWFDNTEADPDCPGISLGNRLNRCITVMHYMGKMVIDASELNKCKNQPAAIRKFDPMDPSAPTTFMPIVDGVENSMNDYQQVILYTLGQLKEKGYKRYKDYVCKQIGNTRAWEKIQKIDGFVETLFDKYTNTEMWQRFTKNGTIRKNLIEHLSVCHDAQFPELKKNRHVFSFKNGLYVARDIDGKPRFYPYESQEFKALDPTVVSAKYFPINFDSNDYDDWYDIPTPALDTILDYQKFPRDVKECILYFIGRMLYDVNEMEKWQVVLFLKGMASTGKGMICQVATYFYEDEDVGTLSDNPEKQFGLSAIYDKFCFIAPEITSKFSLGQADFQSMISGESVSIGRKFKTAESVRWGVPGIFAGNEPPGYHDNSGSIQRRLVTIPFPVQVRPEDIDTELPDKLRMEIPNILRKSNEAYHDAISKFVKGGIWAHLPPLVKNTREEMALSTNALRHFMASPSVEYGEDKKIPKSVFIQHFNEHCKANNLGRYKFTPDFYNGPFSGKNIRIEQTTIIYEQTQKSYKNQPIIIGLDVKDDDQDMFSTDH